MNDNEVLVSRIGRLGRITLNRPEALNSLTLGMVRALTRALEDFVADASISAVLVDGAGTRGLCAGGDIRLLYETGAAGHAHYKTFWREEYRLNSRIAHFPKPYVVIMDGATMGGGIGVSAHGNRRVVTERSRLAMPETGIGFLPDVGGTWLLTRRGGAGHYLALAGVAVGAADAIHVGLADSFVSCTKLGALARRLTAIRDATDVDAALAAYAEPAGKAPLARHAPLLDRVMRQARVEEIIDGLLADGSEFGQRAAGEIRARSPTSVKVTHELLKRASVSRSLEDCLVDEFRAASKLLESHDLYEGIRAAIIDKDRRPRWSPATLAEVDEASVGTILAGSGDPDPFETASASDRERTST